jgi:AcrR family transcriptional regulator
VAKRQPRGLETRDRIMNAALGLFAERGYPAVAIDDIAEAAGVTKGAVYYWFADKDDLGRDLQHELYGRLGSIALRALDPKADVVTNMRRAFEVYLDELGSLGQARFFLRDSWTIPELDEAGRRDQNAAFEMVRGILAAARDRGEIVDLDADALAHVLLGAWAEATLHVLTTAERGPTVAVVEHLIESLRATGQSERHPVERSTSARAASATRS